MLRLKHQQKQGPRTVQVKGKMFHQVEQFIAGVVELFEICTTVVAEIFRGWLIVCYFWWDVRLEVRINGEDTAPENRRLGPRKRHCLVSLATKFQEFLLLVIVGG